MGGPRPRADQPRARPAEAVLPRRSWDVCRWSPASWPRGGFFQLIQVLEGADDDGLDLLSGPS